MFDNSIIINIFARAISKQNEGYQQITLYVDKLMRINLLSFI